MSGMSDLEPIAKPAAEAETHPLHFITAVWGESYVSFFLDVCLPSQLSAGNLAGLRRPQHTLYRIFTTRTDAERIKASAAFRQLEKLVPVDFVIYPSPQGEEKHHFVVNMQKAALRDVYDTQAGVVFLAPDIIVGDGTFLAVERHFMNGKAAVMIAGPRLYKPTFVPEIMGHIDETTGALSIAPRTLVALALRHLHPVTQSLFWGRKWLSNWPSNLYWRLGDEAFLSRYWHMHPLMVVPSKLSQDFSRMMQSTIDGDLLVHMEAGLESLHICTDSDEITVFELSDDRINTGLLGRKRTTLLSDLVLFASRGCNRMHRKFFQFPVIFHTQGLESARKHQDAIQNSDTLVQSILLALCDYETTGKMPADNQVL
jgi:hypothetical protein